MEFLEFPKIPRLAREIIITEKIDGTNAQIAFSDEGEMFVGSRTRWITPDMDNHGFAKWAFEHESELRELGPGRHFGEWWGSGIQRGYGLEKGEKRFSLFNTSRWTETRPACCSVVPVLYQGPFHTDAADSALAVLRANGSVAAPWFMKPEGIVLFHIAGNFGFKRTLEKDDVPKSFAAKAIEAGTGETERLDPKDESAAPTEFAQKDTDHA